MPACRHNLKRAKPGSIPCSYPFSLGIPLAPDHLLLPSGMIPICFGNLVPTASMVLANMCSLPPFTALCQISIPSFYRRSVRCLSPLRRGYGGQRRPDDSVANRAYSCLLYTSDAADDLLC